jgi:pullulanase/glycogen debranching enzyme
LKKGSKDSRIINQFELKRTIFNEFHQTAYIPGSSIKGSIKTAWMSKTAVDKSISDERNIKYCEPKVLGGTFSDDPFRFVKYWVEEYHIDGFRFDLGTIIDKHTFGRILNELPQDIIVVAEPWAADWKRNQWGKSDFRNTRLGKWNDDYRENIRAFVSGNGNRNDVMTVLAGTCFWWTAKPTESLNYIEAHDGYTLYDLYKGDKKKTRLAAITLLTSQGIPMIHAGQEFNRSKGGNHNSYDQDNEINWIDWTVKQNNLTTFKLYKGLIALRKKYDNFKHATALNNQSLDWILPANQNGVGMILKGNTTFIVLLNGDQGDWVNFKLPAGTWEVVCDGEKVKEAGLYTAEGDYNVPPVTGIILRK